MLPGLEDWLTVLIRTTILKPYILPERCDPHGWCLVLLEVWTWSPHPATCLPGTDLCSPAQC